MTLPLEKQVVSLELAKRLKESGVKQQSAFYWVRNYCGTGEIAPDLQDAETVEALGFDVGDEGVCAAFTVAELGEMLRDDCLSGRTERKAKTLGKWVCAQSMPKGKGGWGKEGYFLGHGEYADTEAEARGLMLAYLLEHSLITL